MRTIKPSSQFKKDLKKIKRNPSRMKGLKIFTEDIILSLLQGRALDSKHLDHKLIGEQPSKRDCHVLNNLVLLYGMTDEHLLLYRLGTHSDLFG